MTLRIIAAVFAVSFTTELGALAAEVSSVSSEASSRLIQTDKQSDATLKVANDFMAAMSNGNMEQMINLMHEDMVWHNEGDQNLPWIGPWKGKKVILEEFMPVFDEQFKTIQWETEDAMASGNTAAFFGKMVGLATKTNQKTTEFSFALRVKVKNGKIILWHWFEDSYEVSNAYHGN